MAWSTSDRRHRLPKEWETIKVRSKADHVGINLPEKQLA